MREEQSDREEKWEGKGSEWSNKNGLARNFQQLFSSLQPRKHTNDVKKQEVDLIFEF